MHDGLCCSINTCVQVGLCLTFYWICPDNTCVDGLCVNKSDETCDVKLIPIILSLLLLCLVYAVGLAYLAYLSYLCYLCYLFYLSYLCYLVYLPSSLKKFLIINGFLLILNFDYDLFGSKLGLY